MTHPLRITVLTSSRADYGIYLPLLRRLHASPDFELRVVAFGTHLSAFHGRTVAAIHADGFPVVAEPETLLGGDTREAISAAMGLTMMRFAAFWQEEVHRTDLIVCLGDRYEMFAAVAASLPFNIPIAHIHGGETTLGAIDNVFRHSLSQMATYHFAATPLFVDKIREMTGSSNVWHVGAMSLDNLMDMKLLSASEFQQQFGMDLSEPTILVTFHPETVAPERNLNYTEIVVEALESADMQVLITMPNADTMGNQMRPILQACIDRSPRIFGVETLGTLGYFSAMKHCAFLLGNTSSGILEAASFGRNVIDLGDRQKGRACGENVIHTAITPDALREAISQAKNLPTFTGANIYWNGGAAATICEVLRTLPVQNPGS